MRPIKRCWMAWNSRSRSMVDSKLMEAQRQERSTWTCLMRAASWARSKYIGRHTWWITGSRKAKKWSRCQRTHTDNVTNIPTTCRDLIWILSQLSTSRYWTGRVLHISELTARPSKNPTTSNISWWIILEIPTSSKYTALKILASATFNEIKRSTRLMSNQSRWNRCM